MNIKEINSLSFIESNKILLNFIESSCKIKNKELRELLELKEKELVSTFLEGYEDFTNEQLKIIEDYINNNLNIDERDFVSDLIDFASAWVLNIDYKKLLFFLNNDSEDEHFVVLSTINYITENMKLFYVDEIVDRMKSILNNVNFFQNVQISAALCLFRVTHDKKYLFEIKEWFNDNDGNVLFLKNKLKLDYYKNKYFCDVEKIIIGN